ncbi:MAG: polysaccharide deacetylase family protein [Methanophagales archaeon]|nr:polysaccharide deacetylase family protein [Methanophagales archaeon]
MITTVCITGDIDDGRLEDKKCLDSYFEILNKFDIGMTIPVTAEAVKDYPERIRYIIKYGHEIAGHGDVHTAFYGSIHDQIKRLQSMIDTIHEILGVQIKDFRASWLQHNENTYVALGEVGLTYDSSRTKNELMFVSPTLRKRNINIEGRYATLTGKMPFGSKIALDIYKIARGKSVVLKSYKKALVFHFYLMTKLLNCQ